MGGTVILRIADAAESTDYSYLTIPVGRDGTFELGYEGKGKFGKAYYVPMPGFSECESETFAFGLRIYDLNVPLRVEPQFPIEKDTNSGSG
jgi:hypothetical protein